MSVAPTGFANRATARSARSVERVKAAIALLKRRGEPVTLRRITAADHDLKAGPARLAESVISRNPDAYRLYDAARSSPRRRPRHGRVRDISLERKTKAALIDLIHDLRDEKERLERCLRQYVFPNGHASSADN